MAPYLRSTSVIGATWCIGCWGALACVIGRRLSFDSYVARCRKGAVGAHEASNVVADTGEWACWTEDLIEVMGILDLVACWASAYVSGPW